MNKTKTMGKRLLSFVLSLAMVLSTLSLTEMPAEATGDDSLCSVTSNGSVTTYTSWSDAVYAANSATDDCTITLLDDVTTGNTTFFSNEQTITLDLNGHVLRATGYRGSIIDNTGKLIVNDTTPTTEHYFTYNSDEAWEYLVSPEDTENAVPFSNDMTNDGTTVKMGGNTLTSGTSVIKVTGGVITGGCTRDSFFASVVYNGGTFTMNGGTICGNHYCLGGGVYNYTYADYESTFTMNGGTICGNYALLEGGGVYNQGIFTMNDSATISGNTVGDEGLGGGVSCCDGDSEATLATFTMNDSATISGNTVGDEYEGWGGGVSIYAYYFDVTFTMNDSATISGNYAFCEGGGVYSYTEGDGDYEATLTMNSGTISGNTANNGGGVYNYKMGTMVVGGSIKIKDNIDFNGTTNNVYLPTDSKLTLSENPVLDGANIGVTMETLGVFTRNAGADYAPCFFSDDSNYAVIVSRASDTLNCLKLVDHTHSWSYDTVSGSTNQATATCADSSNCTEGSGDTQGTMTVELSTPVSLSYDGTAKAATLTNIPGLATQPTITYYLSDGITQTTSENSGATSDGAEPVNAGSYVAKATLGDGDGAVELSTNFTIGKATPTISTRPSATGITYGALLSTSTLTGGVASVDGTFAWTTETTLPTVDNSGYEVTFTPTDTTNYVTTTCTVGITVTPKTISVTAKDKSSIVGETLATLDYDCDSDSLVGDDAFTGSLETSANKDVVASYSITQGTLSAGNNYNIIFTNGTYTVSAHNHNWTYALSDDKSTITATCSGAGTCSYTDTDKTVTIVKPAKTTYGDSNSANATLTYASGKDTFLGSTPTISYQQNTGTASNPIWTTLNTAPTNVGNYKASITVGENDDAKTAYVEYTISAKIITPIIADIADQAYSGNALTPTVTVKDGDTVLTKDSDYTVSYTANTNIGTATVNVTCKGNYSGTASKNFKINKASQSVDAPTVSSKTYTTITLATQTGHGTTYYAKNETNTAPTEDSEWQTSTQFTGLTPSTTYYFFTKFAGDSNYEASVASLGTSATTPAHVHSWSYALKTGATNVIEATCANDGCSATNKTVTIVKPAKTTYGDSNSADATLTYASGASDFVGIIPSISYQKKNGDSWETATTTAPTDAGTYKANITVGENESAQTAYVEYTIGKASQTVTAPVASAKTATSVTLTAQSGKGTTYYATNNTNTAPADASNWQTSPDFIGLESGTTYYFFTKFIGNDNYESAVSEGTSVITDHVHTWSYALSNNDTTITATCNGAGNCPVTNNQVSLTLTAACVLDGAETWTSALGSLPAIQYYQDETYMGTDPTSLSGGIYTAKVSVGSGNDIVTASRSITIDTHKVIVLCGTADKTVDVKPGETVTVTADAQVTIDGLDKLCDGCSSDVEGLTFTDAASDDNTKKNYTFTMPNADVEVTVEYKDCFPLVITGDGIETTGTPKIGGNSVTATAPTAPAGKEFTGWTSDDVTLTDDQKKANSVMFTMPSARTTLTANYATLYSITKTNCTAKIGNNTVEQSIAGKTVTLTANDPETGKRFKNWTITGVTGLTDDDLKAASLTLTMPEGAVTATANYEEEHTITVTSGTTTDADQKAFVGETISITADSQINKRFKNWSGEGVTFASANSTSTTFTMLDENVTITANYVPLYALSVTNGTAIDASGNTIMQAAENDSVTVNPMDKSISYQRFKAWVVSGITLPVLDANPLAITMPNQAVSLEATYDTAHTITVNGGTTTIANGRAYVGDTVSVTASVPEGKCFKGWTGTGGITFADASETTTTFTMLDEAVTVTANYVTLVEKPTASMQSFTYNGSEQTYVLNNTSASTYYTVTGNTQTNAGTQTVIVALKDKTNTEWADKTTDDLTFDFTIDKKPVTAPMASSKIYTYNGKAQTYELNTDPDYTISDNITQTNAGTYTVTATLNDTDNTQWSDGTDETESYTFTINPAVVEIPSKDTTIYTYTGKEQIYGVSDGVGYTVIGNKRTEAGSQDVTIKLSSGYKWSDNTTSDKTYTFTIGKKSVTAPSESTKTYTYTGEAQTYNLSTGTDYKISGETQTKAGSYTVTATLTDTDNTQWSDGKTEPKSYTFTINKKSVTAPTASTKTYTYTGEAQTYDLSAGTDYTLSDNITQTNVGTYNITATLNDADNTQWSDGTTADKSYTFTINKKSVTAPTASTKTYTYTGEAQTYNLSAGTDYTISGATQTKAGSYTVTATLNDTDNTQWSDGKTEPKSYTFTINKKSVTAPSESTKTYTYTGKAQTYDLSAGTDYKISGATQTKTGSYTVTATLTDTDNTQWSDGKTEPKSYTFTINKKSVTAPTASTKTYTYTGEAQTYDLSAGTDYKISGATQTKAGSYTVTATLIDTANTQWSDGKTDPKSYTFTIGKKLVDYPEPDDDWSYYYNGKAWYAYLLYAYDSNYYTVTDETGKVLTKTGSTYYKISRTKIGTYPIKVTLKDTTNTQWLDGTTAAKTFNLRIRGRIKKSMLKADPRTFTYNGKEQKFLVWMPINGGTYDCNGVYYDVTGNVQKEVGTYTVTVTLRDNYEWSDGTRDPLKFTFEIQKRKLDGKIFHMVENSTGKIVSGYGYNEYYFDPKNSGDFSMESHKNSYVNAIYTPLLYNVPDETTAEYYVKDADGNEYSWDMLRFYTLQPGTYTLYATLKCEGYDPYTTPGTTFKVYDTPYYCQGCSAVYGIRLSSITIIGGCSAFMSSSREYVNTIMDEEELCSRRFTSKLEALDWAYNGINDDKYTIVRLKGNHVNIKATVLNTTTNENDDSSHSKSNKKSWLMYIGKLYNNAVLEKNKLSTSSLTLYDVPDGEEQREDQDSSESSNNYLDWIISDDLPESSLLEDETFMYDAGLVDVEEPQVDSEEDVAALKADVDELGLNEAEKTYTVTYEYNMLKDGATYTESSNIQDCFKSETENVLAGSKLTKENPTEKGYVFKGWYTFKTYGEDEDVPDLDVLDLETDMVKWDMDNDVVNEDITLYAMWSPASADDGGDVTAPTIAGIADGGTYSDDITIQVSDDVTTSNWIMVYDNDTFLDLQADGKYTISADNKTHIITAKDWSGNDKTVTFSFSSEPESGSGSTPTTLTTPTAPTGLKVVTSTTGNITGGKVTGVDVTMEYSTDGGKTWISVSGNEITDLSAGVVLIRTKATNTTKASDAVTIVISDDTEQSSITVTSVQKTANALALNAGLKVSQNSSKIKVSWGKVADADGYLVYVSYCGTDFGRDICTVENPASTSLTIKSINHKVLNLKKNYKVCVTAYKNVDGKKITIGKSITAHIVGYKNIKYTNVKSITLKSSKSVSLKVGKTSQINAKVNLVDKKRKELSDAHASEFRYASSNKSVATVSKSGKITAVKQGICTVYVYAKNGYCKKVKVTVK